ncbi:MAG TPA: preprotein translocase subunit SecA [Ramlibacter sp.]|uniref:preprotein translocase subunit SecA n=1 Tax=Ramlibacter sp. TaxID=1917967 RepID=UPI002C78D92F|nr:preprotein translocase subunit SecA [Ramlibacter sp.]HVZ46414.1 preprotein translocase subunit SecA [Ramlibacter sp.]
MRAAQRRPERLREDALRVSAQALAAGERNAGADALERKLAEACEALKRTLHVQPRWQQIMAARAMLGERLVEMDTGEGKTIAIALAAATAAALGSPVHVVTANDYLAARDAGELARFYARLGLRAGCVSGGMDERQRRFAYSAHVTYVTARELAFDYLRDAVKSPRDGTPLEQRARLLAAGSASAPLLPGLCVALIDEADTVLLDEARVPFVLAESRGRDGEAAFLAQARHFASMLREGTHFRLEAGGSEVRLLATAHDVLRLWPRVSDALFDHPAHRENAVVFALTARHVLRKGRDYLVRGGAVELVDGASGRLSIGRAWSHGLHQLVELNEGLSPTQPHEPLARITFQQFFARYVRLAGISGTLNEGRRELARVYGVHVLRVPAHRPRRVEAGPTRLFADGAALWTAVAQRAQTLSRADRPVLIGVGSVAESQALSRVLRERGIAHRVLDASQGEEEREVLAAAGAAGAITVATSMAGRGSDIRLDARAAAAGGLHVLLTQQNASPRTDRQFLGRAGRQGQPGSCEHWVAADQGPVARLLRGRRSRELAARCAGWPATALLRAVQTLRAYTEMQQRVTLLRATEAEGRHFVFSRNSIA